MKDAVNNERAIELVNAMRSMRKWGFSICEDRYSKSQSHDERLSSAKVSAKELLGLDPSADSSQVDTVAEAILGVAQSTENLVQFN
jgi:hypothetical protein